MTLRCQFVQSVPSTAAVSVEGDMAGGDSAYVATSVDSATGGFPSCSNPAGYYIWGSSTASQSVGAGYHYCQATANVVSGTATYYNVFLNLGLYL